MKKTALFLFSVIFNLNFIFGQTIINTPSINKYANVVTIDYCTNTLSVPPGMGSQFSIGDKILIIQMKGASLVETNDVFSGQIDDYNNAGNYEVNEILSINSSATDDIVFKYELSRAYNVSGSVQVVNIPQYEDVIIQNILTCQAWNGSFGGILAFNATGKIIMNADIDVSKKGFRGGNGIAPVTGNACYTLSGGYNDYNCIFSDDCGARKGEGIGNRYISEDLGRGKNANGGGGGNDHNAGGAGGGAFGFGGRGGDRTNGFCLGIGGVGGEKVVMNKTVNKILCSGGGGAGDANNATSANEQGAFGGNAGGLIFITAQSLKSNGNKILSNGETRSIYSIEDGAGGGGAGGVAILDIKTYNDNVNIELNGGKGGDAEAQSSCAGPGGGGSGGTLWISQTSMVSNITLNAVGGDNGLVLYLICAGNSNGAENGQNGGVIYNFSSKENNIIFEKLVLNAGKDTVICGNGGAPLWAEYSSSKEISFNWLWNSGTETEKKFLFQPESSGFYDVVANANYTVFNQYCEEVFITHIDIRKPDISIVANSYFGDTVKIGEPIFINAVINPLNSEYKYTWSPKERVDPNDDRNATAIPYETGPFCLTVTDEIDCSNTKCIDLYVHEPKILTPNAFSPNNDDVNNTFIPILTEDLKVLYFRIYDRWGDLVYETKENEAWDGKKDGNNLPADIYIWYLNVEQILSGKTFERMGEVSIVR